MTIPNRLPVHLAIPRPVVLILILYLFWYCNITWSSFITINNYDTNKHPPTITSWWPKLIFFRSFATHTVCLHNFLNHEIFWIKRPGWDNITNIQYGLINNICKFLRKPVIYCWGAISRVKNFLLAAGGQLTLPNNFSIREKIVRTTWWIFSMILDINEEINAVH